MNISWAKQRKDLNLKSWLILMLNLQLSRTFVSQHVAGVCSFHLINNKNFWKEIKDDLFAFKITSFEPGIRYDFLENEKRSKRHHCVSHMQWNNQTVINLLSVFYNLSNNSELKRWIRFFLSLVKQRPIIYI